MNIPFSMVGLNLKDMEYSELRGTHQSPWQMASSARVLRQPFWSAASNLRLQPKRAALKLRENEFSEQHYWSSDANIMGSEEMGLFVFSDMRLLLVIFSHCGSLGLLAELQCYSSRTHGFAWPARSFMRSVLKMAHLFRPKAAPSPEVGRPPKVRRRLDPAAFAGLWKVRNSLFSSARVGKSGRLEFPNLIVRSWATCPDFSFNLATVLLSKARISAQGTVLRFLLLQPDCRQRCSLNFVPVHCRGEEVLFAIRTI